MEALAENWFFLLVLLFCVGAHFLGHGHGRGHRHGSRAPNEDGGGPTRDPERLGNSGE